MSGNSKPSAAVLDCGPDVLLGPLAGRVGLRNMGNTCFMNAGLQCICHIEPLAEYFLKDGFESDLSKVTTDTKAKAIDRRGALSRSFASLLKELWQSGAKAPAKGSAPNSKVLVPKEFRNTFKKLRPFLFENNEQQDVQEFIGFFLDGLNEDLNRVSIPTPMLTEGQRNEDERLSNEKGEEFAAALSWHRHLEREKSFLVDLLQGQLRSSVSCNVCGHTSKKYEPFMYLSVPVEQGMTKMSEAIDKYLEEEVLEGDERWHCDKCKTKVDARKKIDLWFLPPVLVLHLKRFDSSLKKIEKRLTMNVNRLDLSGFCSKTQKDGAFYDVTCVANHHGSFNSGHYTAACRVGNPSSGTWHLFDDAKVTELKDCRSVVTQQTYVVFLVRSGVEGATAAASRRLSSAKSSAAVVQPKRTLLRRQSTSKPDDWPHALSPAVKARKVAQGIASPSRPVGAIGKSPVSSNCKELSDSCSKSSPAGNWICSQCDEPNKVARSECNNCGRSKNPAEKQGGGKSPLEKNASSAEKTVGAKSPLKEKGSAKSVVEAKKGNKKGGDKSPAKAKSAAKSPVEAKADPKTPVGEKGPSKSPAEEETTPAVAPFVVGQLVERRDAGEDWAQGLVLSLDPLTVTVSSEAKTQRGHVWDEVRHLQPDESEDDEEGEEEEDTSCPAPSADIRAMLRRPASAMDSKAPASAMDSKRQRTLQESFSANTIPNACDNMGAAISGETKPGKGMSPPEGVAGAARSSMHGKRGG